jgi:hypothetical protein
MVHSPLTPNPPLLLPSQLCPGRYTIVPAAIVGFDALNGDFLDVLLNTLQENLT